MKEMNGKNSHDRINNNNKSKSPLKSTSFFKEKTSLSKTQYESSKRLSLIQSPLTL